MDSSFPWLILGAVVIFGIVVYLIFMIFLPEWVGITGKTAIENERSHRGDLPLPGEEVKPTDETPKT